MFKTRVLTALILLPMVIWLVLLGSPFILMLVGGIILGLMAYEWGNLVPLRYKSYQILFILCCYASFYASLHLFSLYIYTSILLLMIMFICILSYPKTAFFRDNRAFILMFGLILLPSFLAGIVWVKMHMSGSVWLMTTLVLIWATDTGGYLFGRLFGKHKLIPLVSPGKTLEGTLGSFLLVLFIGSMLAWHWGMMNTTWLIFISMVWLISSMGDLTISLLKRRVHLKDTGHLLPGHGGFLDRLDSLIAVIPFVCYFLSLNLI